MKNESFEHEALAESEPQTTGSSELLKRRRVLLGGSVGAILASMKSGSALAGGVCSSPSAFGSIAANPVGSHQPHTFPNCTPRSHGYYGNTGNTDAVRTARWNPVNWRVATLADTGFSSAGHWQMTTKLYEIVKSPSTIGWNPDGNLIVLWLDVVTGHAGDALTVDDVKALWDILFGLGTSNPRFDGWTAATVQAFYSAWVGAN